MSEDFISTLRVPEFHFLNPRHEDILIEDIAHALALTCRFGGHGSTFYSVAEHSILVSHVLSTSDATPLTALAGLLHDAEEAYLPDIPSPIKRHLGDAIPIYEKLNNCIIETFKLQDADWTAVKDIDSRIVNAEAIQLGIWHVGWEYRGAAPKVTLLFFDWEMAEKVFMMRYKYLKELLT